jgi:hypothetical protein
MQKQKKSFSKSLPYLCLVGVITLGLMTIVGSGGGGGGGTATTTTPTTGDGGTTAELTTLGWEVPQELSAVPTSLSPVVATSNRSLRASLRNMALAYDDEDTDYSNALTKKFVEEHTLAQFDILEQVFNAINQTHYSDEENINADPYKCMVAWQDEQNGVDIKRLEPWVVESDEIEEDGQTVLRVRAWIEEVDEETGEPSITKAELKMTEAPTRQADGSYTDYGAWTLNVKFDETGENDYFVASASKTDEGTSLIKVHERFLEAGPMGEFEGIGFTPVMDMKAIMNRGTESGYGRVQYPDFEALFGPDVDLSGITELPHKTAQYSYNEDYLAVQDEGESGVYKDRNTITEMTHRYGVYNLSTGADVMKSKSFGFPIRYTADGVTNHAYYGAWQGRHQIWGPETALPAGTTVSREDLPPDQSETYTVGPTFNGVLTKRTYVDADIDDIKDIPIEMWVNNDYNLIYDGGEGAWYSCKQWNWETNECAVTPSDFDATVGLDSLIVGENDTLKSVWISGWDDVNMEPVYYVYEAASADNDGAGFYPAELVETEYGQILAVITPKQLYTPDDGDQLWAFVSGQIFVEWKGADTGWVEKEVTYFDTMTWTPEFSDVEREYTLPEGKEIYANLQGANYVITRSGTTYTTKLEIQTAANPGNASTVVASGAVLKDPWNPEGSSTYELDTDSASNTYMLLVYKTIGDSDKNPDGTNREGVAVGAVVARSMWGLEAYDAEGTATGIMYNWEYSSTGGWGSVTYLLDSDDTYKLLDDPMRFDSITAQNNAGDTKTLALQYDGWFMGLPDLYQELEKNDWTMTTAISDKIINLPAGTELTESSTGTDYVIKPLEISQFLTVVPDTTSGLPDISLADAVDLTDVPDFVEHGMGAMPEATLKYSEGELVE